MRTRLASIAVLIVIAAHTVAAEVPLPEGARLRIGNPNVIRVAEGTFGFSPDGQSLLVRESRTAIRTWNLANRTRGELLTGPAPYYLFAMSPDGKWFAEREQLNTLRLWNAVTGSKERRWETPGMQGKMAFTPDSRYLLGAHQSSSDYKQPDQITVWDLTADAPLRTFTVGTMKNPRASHFVLSPEGKTVAVVGQEVGPVRFFELNTGKETLALGKASGWGSCLMAYRGADQFVIGFGNDISVFDLTKPDAKPTVTRLPRTIEAVSADGSRAAITTPEFCKFQIWDLTKNQAGAFFGFEHTNSRSAPVFSPDGKVVAVMPGGGTTPIPVRIWDTNTGTELFANTGHPTTVTGLAVIENGKTIVSSAADGRARFWNLATGAAQKPFDFPATSVELSADGTRLLLAAPNQLTVYNAVTLKQLRQIEGLSTEWAMSPDGKRIARRKGDRLQIFDVDGSALVHDEDFLEKFVSPNGFAFGPDNKRLIGQPIRKLFSFDLLKQEKPLEYVQTYGFFPSPDATKFAYHESRGSQLVIRDSTTGKELNRFPGDAPSALVWSRDGSMLGLGLGPTWEVRSVKTGKSILRRVGHTEGITAIAFTPDGKSLVTGGRDNLVYVWDLPATP